MSGVIEGLSLARFLPGYVYEVTEFVGRQLVELHGAIEVRSTDPALATTADEEVDLDRLNGGVHVVPRETADDRRERRSKRYQQP